MIKRALFFIVVGAALLAGLFVWFRPASQTAPPAASQGPARYTFVVRNGARVAGPEVVRIRRGRTLKLTVTSDHADELHIHGYDRQRRVPANTAVTLTLDAERAGRFPVELHGADIGLTTLEVKPR